MKEIIESFFRERSLVNHQLASYDDCIPTGDNSLSRMEKIVRNIRVGTDEEVDDDMGGLIKLDVIDQDIIIRVKNIINIHFHKPFLRVFRHFCMKYDCCPFSFHVFNLKNFMYHSCRVHAINWVVSRF